MQIHLDIFSKIPTLVLIILAAGTTILGDIFAKYWSLDQRLSLFIFALISYGASGIFYLPVLLKEGLVITSIVWTTFTLIGFIFVGVVMFHEKLLPIQGFGVGLGIIAILILTYYSH